MTRDEAVEIYTNIHRMRMSNDPDKVRTAFTGDATFCLTGARREGSIAMGDVRAPLEDVVGPLVSEWEWVSYDILSIAADGDQVAARAKLRVRHVPTDTVFDTEVADFVTLRDGKVADMRQFVDTAHVGAIVRGEA